MAKPSVLIVDDIFANQFLLASMLEEMDCDINIASNGKEVFEKLDELYNAKSKLFDIIFMDIEMPIMNGLEATKKLKADYRYRQIPVVALTAHNLEEFKADFDDAGFDDILEKPYSYEGISDVLSQLKFV